MRTILLIGWVLLLPIGGLYHTMAGPEHREHDAIGDSLAEARALVAQDLWPESIPRFQNALEEIPEGMEAESRQVRLEFALAKMNAAKLPEAHAELKGLLDELLEDENSDNKLERNVREALANSQFYMTWLMRLEGLPAEKWEPEIESARQNYRMLAESAVGSADTEKQKENVEAAIRLARLDLGDLQGLPLPNQ